MTPIDPLLERAFGLAGQVALVGWAALALVPLRFGWPRAVAVAAAMLLAAGYAALIGAFVAGGVGGGRGGFGSLAEVRQLFETPGLLLAGWVHYLAFDLLVGTWMRGEAARIGLPQWKLVPCLAATFLLGPIGWLVFLALRTSRRMAAAAAAASAPAAAPVPAPASAAGALRAAWAGFVQRQPALAAASVVSLAAIVPCLLAMPLDARTINGIDVWVKPAKFLLSFCAYYATLAWLFGWMDETSRRSALARAVVGTVLVVGVLEMAWLLTAAVLGEPAHFNIGHPAWRAAYSAAGVGATLLVFAVAVQGWLVWRHPAPGVSVAERTAALAGGAIVFVATSFTAFALASGTGHWVGGTPSDAGGLWLFGWARAGGDLRVAHFFALHAQQALPLAGVVLARALPARAAVPAVLAFAAASVGLVAFAFVQARAGAPFLPLLAA